MLSITPKNTRFFDLLDESGSLALRIADLLLAGSQDRQPPHDVAATALTLRDANDQAFDHYVDELHEAFVTPIDRDDLYYLGFELEKLVEAMERLANRWVIYELPATDPAAAAIIERLQASCKHAAEALPLLRRRSLMGKVAPHFREIRRFGHEAEQLHRNALQALARSGDEGIKTVLRKEMLDLTMAAVHACRRLADTLHKAVIRNV